MTTVPAPEAGRWLALLTDSLPTFVWSADAALLLTACQGGALGLVGLAPSDVVGRAVAETFGAGEAGSPALLAHQRVLEGHTAEYECAWMGRVFRARLEPLRDEQGEICGVLGAAVDGGPAERTPAERVLLPGLPGFLSVLGQRIASGEAIGSALVVLDLDGFAALNARIGYEAGDEVLSEAARRLGSRIRGTDLLGRCGGDAFAVLVTGGGEGPGRVAERLRLALEEPMEVAGLTVRVRASAGVVRIAEGQDAWEALRDAETAMLRAKALGRGRWAELEGRVDRRTASLRRVEAEVRRAIGRDELRAHFEPTLAVKSGRVDGFEVLLWKRTSLRAPAASRS